MKKKAETQIESMISTKQVATILGISEKSVTHMVETGELPSYRIGRLWKFKRNEVQTYIEAHQYKPEQEEKQCKKTDNN